MRLLDHATVNFGAADVLTFLGRKPCPQFLGEVITDCKKHRLPGARIKHQMKNNWLKMYDKFGRILRVETVINDPSEFRVRRKRERNGEHRMVWCPMNKNVANLHHVERVARAANQRYREALSVVNDPAPSYCKVERLAERQVVARRTYAGFNPARRDDKLTRRAAFSSDSTSAGSLQSPADETLAGHGLRPVDPWDRCSPPLSRPGGRHLKDARRRRACDGVRI